jgi:hypothetical protein
MNNNIKTQQTTFWQFQSKNKIEIPIIQRDYAQGRKGNEILRKNFLKNLKEALDNKEKLKLDFLYGKVENDALNPLDGQQRLTTLWLLHWYIALKAGKLQENKENFKRFTYETRVSSREFFYRLCEFHNIKDNDNIIDTIQNQTWFYSAWKQDPTIQAILRMLSGTTTADESKNIIDGIEMLFKDCNEDKFSEYWKILISEDCPIIFYYLPLHELKFTDDLYIKMNARGEQLSSFENFKADFVGFIIDQAEENEEWKKFSDAKEGIPIKLDTAWTNIFWQNRSNENNIDDIYFAFVNRYIFNCLIIAKNNGNYAFTQEQIEEKPLFNYLYGDKCDDTNVKYSGFDIYKSEKIIYDENIFTGLKNILNRFHEIFKNEKKLDNLFTPHWSEISNFRFIPEYKNNNTISALTQPQRIVFFAICKYFEIKEYEEISFKRWIRVVWNIVENTNINTVSAMISTVRLIDELATNSHSIYDFLKENIIKSTASKEQIEEEREKAKQILDEKNELKMYDGQIEEFKDKTWEEVIIEAEKYAFFKGAIRFLFFGVDGKINWKNFDIKWKNANMYFNENGVREEFKNNAILLRSLISQFTIKDQFLSMDYDHNGLTWKNILTKQNISNAVNNLMLDINNIDLNIPSQITQDEKMNFAHTDLYNKKILTKICESCTFKWQHNQYALYPHNTKSKSKIYVIGNKRNEILSKLLEDKKIEILNNHNSGKLNEIPFFWGWDIDFTFNNKYFQWNTDENIYLMDQNQNRIKDEKDGDIFVKSSEINNTNIFNKLNNL